MIPCSRHVKDLGPVSLKTNVISVIDLHFIVTYATYMKKVNPRDM